MSAPFRKIHSVLHFSQLISDQSTSGQHGVENGCVLLATWSMAGHGLLSHSGYVSIYDIKMEYPITVSFRRVPVGGACAHLCPSLFLFFPLCCAWSSLSLLSLFLSLSLCLSLSLSLSHFFLCWEICRNVLFTALKKNCHVTLSLLLFIVSFFPPSCNILVFTVVFPLCIYKAVLTLK